MGRMGRKKPSPAGEALPSLVRLTPEQQALAEQWIRAAHKLAFEYERMAGVQKGSYLAAAWEALSTAARCFNPELGFRFSTYAYAAMKRKLYREMMLDRGRTSRGRKKPEGTLVHLGTAMADMVSVDRRREVSGVDEEDEPAPWVVEVDPAWWRGALDEREITVLEMRFVQGLTLAQTGTAVGITMEGARRVQVRALRKARMAIEARTGRKFSWAA